MRTAAALALIGGLILTPGTEAFAEKRVALVIGNAAYINASKLVNPPNDVTAVSVMLETAGFSVVETRTDLGNAEMRKVIRDFSDQTRDADVAVVYYAGHGIEVGNTNFLIPIDAKLERDIDVDDEAIVLDRVLQVIEPARKLRLVILDACRDNPFTRTMKRTMATRAVGRGLAKYEPTMSNTLVAFAASPGATVLDGDGANSPFTTALVKYITKPDLDLRIAFGNVRDDVLKSTSNRQEPYISGSLGGGTIALVRSTSVPDRDDQAATSMPAPVTPGADASRDYELAMQVGTVAIWDEYLRTHTTGFYANLARAQRAKLLAAVSPPPPAAAPAAAVVPPQTATRALAPPEPSQDRKRKKREAKRTRAADGGGSSNGPQSEGCAAAKRTLKAAMALGFDNRDGVVTAVRAKCGR